MAKAAASKKSKKSTKVESVKEHKMKGKNGKSADTASKKGKKLKGEKVKNTKKVKEVKERQRAPRKAATGLVAMSDGKMTWLEGHLQGYRYRLRDNLAIINNRTGYYWIALVTGDGYTMVSVTGFNQNEEPLEPAVFRLSADNAAKRLNKVLKRFGFDPSSMKKKKKKGDDSED